MKKAIIYYKDTDNIGDDIQTYAAKQLIGTPDYCLDRENLDQATVSPHTRLLCNGWFMKNPNHWPPHPHLHPLFISLYIDHKHGCYEKMLNPSLIPYYQTHAPIGCRDLHTLRLFQELKIPAYFSACVTLTLPKFEVKKSNEILLVDPFVKIFDPKYTEAQIHRLIPQKYMHQVSTLTHHDFELKHLPLKERMEKVEKLLKRYQSAKFIITSRIHCALPATALGTPVYFTDVGYDRAHAHERLEGLLGLFKVIEANHFPVSSNQPLAKVLRKLGWYPKSKVKNNPIDFELSEQTFAQFETKFAEAKKLADHIQKITHSFFET